MVGNDLIHSYLEAILAAAGGISAASVAGGGRFDPARHFVEEGTRTNSSQDYHIDIFYDGTPSDENEKKMEGRRSYIFTMAASSLVWAMALVPYWTIYCSHTTLSIPKIWMDVLHIGYIFLIIIAVIVTAQSSQFKDGKLPDNAGFRFLQIMQAVVVLFLWAGTFIPQNVCRGMSNLVVWTSAAGALLIIVLSWSVVFQHKTVIKCIKAPCQMVINCIKAPCQMVIKCTKVMYDEKVQRWLPDLSLPECIKAKFKKNARGEELPGRAQGASLDSRTLDDVIPATEVRCGATQRIGNLT